MKIKAFLIIGIAFFVNPKIHAQTVTDIDGNVYHTVTIGTQVWMVENLKTTKYRNGDLIGTTTPATLDIGGESTPKYQWAYDGNESNVATYGRLYTWYAATDSRNIAPTGWHVPTDAEWTTLTTYLGGESVAGGKMKEAGTTHWFSPNNGADNSSGFTALPGGYRGSYGSFSTIRSYGSWWSSTEVSTSSVWSRVLYCNYYYVVRHGYYKVEGFSVRCLRDAGSQINENGIKSRIEIFPNPAFEILLVTVSEKQEGRYTIYNSIGASVLVGKVQNGSNEINISSLENGMYIINIIGVDFVEQRKFVKE